MDPRPIGVFDSGVGGLTVVKEIRQILPHESIIYIGDTARVPYGTRSKETITKFATDLAQTLLKKSVKALVVACNTISSTCLSRIRAISPLPVVDVISPTVVEALNSSKTKSIAVIGTSATIKSGTYERLIKDLSPKTKVVSIATPLFVPIIEECLFNHEVADLMIRTYLSPLRASRSVDTIILGCTHYPLIKKKIENYLGDKIRVIDSAMPTAKALKKLLEEKKISSQKSNATQIFFTSDDPSKSVNIARDFLGTDVELRRIEI